MKITTLLISLSLLPMLSHAASNPYNYVTSVKVNQVELNAPVTAHQVSQLLAPPNGKAKSLRFLAKIIPRFRPKNSIKIKRISNNSVKPKAVFGLNGKVLKP